VTNWAKNMKRRQKAGLCRQCRPSLARKPAKGKRLCQMHLDKEAAYKARSRQRLMDEGRCCVASCGQPISQTAKSFCEKHRLLWNEYHRAYRTRGKV
jgi:hypothetical protein